MVKAEAEITLESCKNPQMTNKTKLFKKLQILKIYSGLDILEHLEASLFKRIINSSSITS